MVKRAPFYLRGVTSEHGSDVLDQLDDSPSEDEKVYVYRLVGKVGHVHINRGRHGSGFYVAADYEYLPDVDGELLRDNQEWQKWAAREGTR